MIEFANTCELCGKVVCVSLYLRVKPWTGRSKDLPRDSHRFYGYWPPESHLVEYLKVEAQKHSLQRWYNENCRGHSMAEIVEAIEQSVPPLPGLPIRIMWNPATQVVAYMQAESPEEKRRLKMDIQSQVRTINVYQKAEIKTAILTILNNTIEETPASVSYPGSAIQVPTAPMAGLLQSAAEAEAEIKRLREENRRLMEQLKGSIANSNGLHTH